MKQLLFFFLGFTQLLYGQDTIKPGSNLITQGIPPIPTSIADEVLPLFGSESCCILRLDSCKKRNDN